MHILTLINFSAVTSL